MKKVCSIVLALLLALTTAIPGLASEANLEAALPLTPEEIPNPVENEIPVVSVTVPQTGHIVINPYGLPVDVDGEPSREQIVSEPLPIVNQGDTPVEVWVSAVGRVSEESSMEFVMDLSQLDTGVKGIFLYAEFKTDGESWRGSYDSWANQVLIGDQVSNPQEVLSLDKGESGGLFQLFGSASAAPDDPWGTKDEIWVTFTFTFKIPKEVLEALAAMEAPAEEISAELEETPAPEEITAPEETPTPEEITAPEETPTPEEITAPEETPTPEEITAPEETPASEKIPVVEDPPIEQPVEEPAGESSNDPSGAPTREVTGEPGEEPADSTSAVQESEEVLLDGLEDATSAELYGEPPQPIPETLFEK